jgi:hypothetical protein
MKKKLEDSEFKEETKRREAFEKGKTRKVVLIVSRRKKAGRAEGACV